MPGFAAETAQLIAALKLDDSGFSGKINKIGGQLKKLDSGLSQMGRGAGQLGHGVSQLAERSAIAAAGGLAALVTTAASFEQANVGIEKTASGTQAQIKALEDQLRHMARTVPVSFEELAGIAAEGGALGIATDSLDEFTDVVARLAVSTNLSSDQAATALGQLGNVLHLNGQDMRDFADSLVALGNNGASTEDQIVEIASRFGAAGNAAGLSKEEILALSSAVASMGIDVEAGGSALSRVFNNVATNIGTSSGKAKAFAKTLGLSASEFKEAWRKDALGTFQQFLGKLNELDEFDASSLLKKVGITNTRDVNAVRLMGQNVGFVGDQLQIAEHAQGALNTESDKFFNTTQGGWQIFKNNIRDTAAQLGTGLLPVVNDLFKDFADFLNKPETQQALADFGRDLTTGVHGLVDELKGTDFTPLLEGMKLAASAAKVAFDAFRALPEPIQQLAFAAFVANKASGGAIGSIAKGLGNLLLGSLKTITAGNVTVIGANVTGGGGGLPNLAPGGKGGGVGNLAKGAIKFVLPIAAGVLIANAIRELAGITPEESARQNSRGQFGPRSAANVPKQTLAVIAGTLGSKPLPVADPVLASIEKRNASEHNAAIRQAMLDNSTKITRGIQSHAASERSDLRKLDATTARVPLGLERVKSTADGLLGEAHAAHGFYMRTASATEITSRKKFDPTIRNEVNVATKVSVNASLVQNQIVKVVNTQHGVNFK